MGRKDIVTKEYIRRPEIFADIFNYRLYNGKDRIQPEQLAEENITENLVLEREEHGKQKRIKLEAVEKYRDVKKVFRDGSYRCLLLGVEEQDSVHYAMPVREFVYDAMAYEHQIREISRTHRREKDYKEHGKEEFLSGFYREDRILPVITLVLYFGTAPWDGPRSLKEMMRWTGEEAEKYIQDYRLNLIIPAEMEDEEIEKLQSSLREVFYFLKYAGDWKKLEKILTDASLPGGKTELTGKDIGISSLEKAKVQLYEFSTKEFSMTPTELSSKYRQVPLEELIKMLVALL